jgi:enamine deaminase RidA (YjgF/YER057c/UK114 family)
MTNRIINPWTWQDTLGFVQAHEAIGVPRVLYCAGQLPTNAAGQPIHAGNLPAQIQQALDNLEQLLQAAGYTLAEVVRLTYYTTDVDQLLTHWHLIVQRLTAGGCRCSSTLLGVTRLAYPEMMFEVEATAVSSRGDEKLVA